MIDQEVRQKAPDEVEFDRLLRQREDAEIALAKADMELDAILEGMPVAKAYSTAIRRLWSYEDSIKQSKKKVENLENAMDEHMIQSGIQNLRVDGVTIYYNKQRWAKVEDKEAAKELLSSLDEEYGTGVFVRDQINSQGLSAWIRERLTETDDNDQPLGLPPEFEGVIGYSEVTKIKTRRT